MWLLDVMAFLFVGAMVCLALDLGKRYYNITRPIVIGGVSTAVLVLSLVDLLLNWEYGVAVSIPLRPNDSVLASLYIVDGFSVFVAFTVLAVGLAVSFYSLKHFGSNENIGPFFSLLLLLLLSLIGITFAGDLLTLFLFWEGMSITAYGLVAFRKEVAVSLEAALKYLFLAGTGSLVALFGISMIYAITGSIQLRDLGQLLTANSQVGFFGLLMLIVGLGVEAAIFPLQTWLPDAYSAAPTPVSAALAGAVTETAVFALVKIIQPTFTVPVLTPIFTSPTSITALASHSQVLQIILVAVAILTMLFGNLAGLAQSNTRRMLAYSSIAHVGYMIAALATFSILGAVAILFHIWNHGIVKSSFFMLTGNTGPDYRDSDLGNITGLFKRNRTLGGMFALSSVGLIGVPPFGTFWSELLIVQSLLATHSNFFLVLAVIVVANIVLSVGYLSKIITAVGRSSNSDKELKLNWALTLSPMILLALSLLTGFAPWLLLSRISG